MKLNQNDVAALRKRIEDAVRPILAEHFKQPFHIKFENSVIIHEPLVPQGDKFKFNVTLTAFPKSESEKVA